MRKIMTTNLRRAVVLAAAGFLAATTLPAQAQASRALAQQIGNETASDAPAPRSRTRDGDERRICVSYQASETRLRRRVCRTASEWEARGGLDNDR